MGFTEKKRWLFLGLPLCFTTYHIEEDVLTIDSGLLKTYENDCYMYKIQDVELTRTLLERMLGLGTVICFTGDTTHPKLILAHIKNAREIKDYILEYSEKARIKRRTLNTLDISAEHHDGPDHMDCDHDFADHMGHID